MDNVESKIESQATAPDETKKDAATAPDTQAITEIKIAAEVDQTKERQ